MNRTTPGSKVKRVSKSLQDNGLIYLISVMVPTHSAWDQGSTVLGTEQTMKEDEKIEHKIKYERAFNIKRDTQREVVMVMNRSSMAIPVLFFSSSHISVLTLAYFNYCLILYILSI